MELPYIETDCIIGHEGRKFESGGAVVTDDRVIGYLKGGERRGDRGIVTDWHGNQLGTYVVTSRWSTPNSFLSSTRIAVSMQINGKLYYGRSAGSGMSVTGKIYKQ